MHRLDIYNQGPSPTRGCGDGAPEDKQLVVDSPPAKAGGMSGITTAKSLQAQNVSFDGFFVSWKLYVVFPSSDSAGSG
jgi:hypothetical protein